MFNPTDNVHFELFAVRFARSVVRGFIVNTEELAAIIVAFAKVVACVITSLFWNDPEDTVMFTALVTTTVSEFEKPEPPLVTSIEKIG